MDTVGPGQPVSSEEEKMFRLLKFGISVSGILLFMHHYKEEMTRIFKDIIEALEWVLHLI